MSTPVSEMSYIDRAELRQRFFRHCVTNGLWDPASSYKFKPGWLDRQLQRYADWESAEYAKAEEITKSKPKRARAKKAK